MTTLYRPVLIESAEQAEELARGTVATFREGSAKLTAHHVGRVGTGGDVWLCMDDFMPNTDMVGWTALVPIEAEEETHSIQTRGQTTPEWRTRLVTDWEAAR